MCSPWPCHQHSCGAQLRRSALAPPHFSVPAVPPTISSEGRVVEAAVGQPVELLCSASGNPLPTLSWQKDGLPLPEGAGVLLLAGGTLLRVQRVSESSAGSYTCLASSPAGESAVRHTLLVQGKGAAGCSQAWRGCSGEEGFMAAGRRWLETAAFLR